MSIRMKKLYEASIKYFRGDELAARVWANKYALKDSFGNLLKKLLMICIAGWHAKSTG